MVGFIDVGITSSTQFILRISFFVMSVGDFLNAFQVRFVAFAKASVVPIFVKDWLMLKLVVFGVFDVKLAVLAVSLMLAGKTSHDHEK